MTSEIAPRARRRPTSPANGENPMTELLLALADYKTISKYLSSSFGETLISKALPERKQRPRPRIGSTSPPRRRAASPASGPNLQQTPRDRDLLGEATSRCARRSSRLRASGVWCRSTTPASSCASSPSSSDDEQLLADVVCEGDVHSEVAAVIAGHARSTSPRAEPIQGPARQGEGRQRSASSMVQRGRRPVGDDALTSTRQGAGLHRLLAQPLRQRLRLPQQEDAMRPSATRYIRVVDGGTIYMGQERADLPKCANYPVQRGSALGHGERAIIPAQGARSTPSAPPR
jgi:hypothetical protein